jgi:glutaminyl-peptide cyclotransferase
MYKGSLLANIWQTNNIARIDPETGSLLSLYDMSQLERDVNSSPGYEHYTNSNYVLNGIAYNEKTDRLILTGKMWPFFYEVKFYELE